MTFVNGVEFSCLIDTTDADSDCHILGYHYDMEHEAINHAVQINAKNRKDKLYEILTFLKDQYDIVLPDEAVKRLESIKNIGKPQVADEMVRAGVCEDTKQAFENYLNAFASLLHIKAKDAIEAILLAGGVPVWAHPIGDSPYCEKHDMGEKFTRQLDELMQAGIKGIECCYSRYNDDEIQFLIETAKEKGLYISGGSDYHGTRKNVVLTQTGRDSRQQGAINIMKAIMA